MPDAVYSVRLADGATYGPADLQTIADWAREGRIPVDAQLVPSDGSAPRLVVSEPQLAKILRAPPTVATGVAPPESYSGLIPYKNAPALVGYYTSIASLLPVLGLLAGPAAIVLGVMGFRRVKADPRCKGTAHAWIAVILGSVGTLISVGCVGSMMMGALV